ncbi:MAG: hypothetical protein ACI8UO_002455 [Verrucomicrobiales bacterium]|jgi:hypothetical protein
MTEMGRANWDDHRLIAYLFGFDPGAGIAVIAIGSLILRIVSVEKVADPAENRAFAFSPT